MKFFYLISLVFAQNSTTIEDDNFCRVLGLRGGGTNGAFEIGIMKKMVEYLDPIDYSYDVFQGVSIGGINAASMATFEKGDEKNAIDWLEDMWMTHPVEAFWEWWPILGPVQGLWRKSVLDNSKMQNFVIETFEDRPLKRGLVLMAVDINVGENVIFDETISQEMLPWAIIASASIPFVFPPVSQINPHQMLVDGGVFANVEIDESILKCREKGFDDDHIIVDLILCFDQVIEVDNWSMKDAKYESAYDFYKRRDAFTSFYYYYEEVIRVIRGFPDVQFRHLITPKKPLGGAYIPIFDDLERTEFLINRGIEDGEFYFGNGTRDQDSPRVLSSKSGFEKIRELIAIEEQIEL